MQTMTTKSSMESDLDELVDNDEVTSKFNKAASHLQNIVARLDQDTLLKFYALYKQGSQGPCNIPKPGFFNINGRAKWEAWNSLGNLPQDDAKLSYITLLKNADPEFDSNEDSTGQWVRVSTMASNENELQEFEKSIIDHVKNGTVAKVEQYLKHLKKDDLNEVLNDVDESGLALIHWAADRGFKDVLKLLLDFGADVNLQDAEKQTALHYAASCGHLECIEELLNRKANVEIEDEDGSTARDVANDNNVIALLNSHS